MRGECEIVKINDRIALMTYIMCMGRNIEIKAFHSGYHAHGGDDAFLLEHGQVAVDGAKG